MVSAAPDWTGSDAARTLDGMRTAPMACAACVLLLAACTGISIGDSGEEPSQAAICAPDSEQPVSDLSTVLEGFAQAPEVLLERANTVLVGTLALVDGPSVPVTLTLSVGDDVRVVRSSDLGHDCKPWLQATVNIDVDAGKTLSGAAQGELYARDPFQIRGHWSALADFETTLTPKFDAELRDEPNVVVYLIIDDEGQWQGTLDFAAYVAVDVCDQATQMCAGGSGNFSSEYHTFGELVGLHPAP